ncbi:NACHT domain-containing protein [Pseudomonas sp. MF6754]|uniref:NACHT domain-containing protein n=1 Tax=Pseudomonas sp. MF6754 TaxID=2797529 RepID=UPI00190DB4ED|nr:NACHT domain-containing protein [Pseudomonas sp. MF6754]MBK3455012.1 NACHT domain-containing protein [Pseudomonas sp. MF6754]
MINLDTVYALLSEEESPILEFKRDWYWNDQSTAMEMSRQWGELQKDIISLCNGYPSKCGIDRYLIIGFSETEKKIYSVDTTNIKKLKDIRSLKKDLLAKLVKTAIQPILNLELETVILDGKALIVFKIPSPTDLTELRNTLQTKTTTVPAGVVLVRKGQDEDSVSVASPQEIIDLKTEFSAFKVIKDNEKPKADVKKDRSIKSTVELYIDKNRSLSIEKDYPIERRDWTDNVLFELYKISDQFKSSKYFLYIHENATQNKTYEYIQKNSLLAPETPLIILTERPTDLKDLDRRKSNLRTRFKTDFVYFIDEFGYKNLYSEHMLEYIPYRPENYVEGIADVAGEGKRTALEQLKSWHNAISNPLMVIKGYGGIGKTTLVKQFLDYVYDTRTDTGILFIDSNEISDELVRIARSDHKIDDIYDFYLAQMKKEEFDGKGFSKDLLRLSVDNGNLLIVLDGIDEVIAKLGSQFDITSFITSISTSYSTNLERAKVIITCRDYFWDTLQDQIKVEEITLEPFNEKLAETFFAKYFVNDASKIAKAMHMAAEFRLSEKSEDSDLIYIPYVLDMVAYLIKQRAEFGDDEIHHSKKAKLLSSKIPNDFLVLSVCEREVKKLGSFDIDDQVDFLINLSLTETKYVTDYNIKDLSSKNIDDLTIIKLKAHPLLHFSNNKLLFRYDFFYEYFKGLHVYDYYITRDTQKLTKQFIELAGVYLRYGNQFCETICKKMFFSEELVLLTLESIESLKEQALECDSAFKASIDAAISSMFMLLISVFRETGEAKFDSSSCTDLLKNVFGEKELSGVVLMNILSCDSKRPVFDFRNLTIKNSHFERYDYFWDCQIDEDTRFHNSFFSQLSPRKDLKPIFFDNTFSDDCLLNDMLETINQRKDEENAQSDKLNENLRRLFELFNKRGNFYPQKQEYIRSKIFTGKLLPTLLKNGVIEDYLDPKKPTFRQFRVSQEFRGLMKFIDQGTRCIELDRVIKMF